MNSGFRVITVPYWGAFSGHPVYKTSCHGILPYIQTKRTLKQRLKIVKALLKIRA